MGRDRIELLRAQLTATHERVLRRIDGLTEDEYWWEPVRGCWTLRRQPDGRLREDYPDVHPDPPPFTTIAWRLFHIASCKVIYHEHAFGPGVLTWHTIECPETIDGVVAMLTDGQALLLGDLDGMAEDEALDAPAKTNWGETWPAWRIFWTMIHEAAHHGAEIGTLRDLWTHGLRDHRPVPGRGRHR